MSVFKIIGIICACIGALLLAYDFIAGGFKWVWTTIPLLQSLLFIPLLTHLALSSFTNRTSIKLRFKSRRESIAFIFSVSILAVFILLKIIVSKYVSISLSLVCAAIPSFIILVLLFTSLTIQKGDSVPSTIPKKIRFSDIFGVVVLLAVVFIVLSQVASAQKCKSVGPGKNLSNCILSGKDLKGARLAEANLSNANLANADLSNADLSHATLDGAQLQGTNLTNAALENASFYGTAMNNALLTNANLQDADLSRSDLTGANVTDANFNNANLTGVDLSQTIGLTDASLKNIASWHGLILQNPQEIIAAAASVCNGQGMANAGAYSESSNFHPILLLSDNGGAMGWTLLSDIKPWWPSSTNTLELVACISPQLESPDGVCSYQVYENGSATGQITTNTYSSYSVKVRLVQASNGAEITEYNLVGGGGCSEKPSGDQHGSPVSLNQLMLELSGKVNPDGNFPKPSIP